MILLVLTHMIPGIDMVKISDIEAAAKYNVINLPSLVYFRKQVPLLYDGKLFHTRSFNKRKITVALFYDETP